MSLSVLSVFLDDVLPTFKGLNSLTLRGLGDMSDEPLSSEELPGLEVVSLEAAVVVPTRRSTGSASMVPAVVLRTGVTICIVSTLGTR